MPVQRVASKYAYGRPVTGRKNLPATSIIIWQPIHAYRPSLFEIDLTCHTVALRNDGDGDVRPGSSTGSGTCGRR